MNQDYPAMRNTRILVADAASTDDTCKIVRSFADRLDVDVIPGGLPSIGRNAGAALATTRYILFLDADIELASNSLVKRALQRAQKRNLHCVTTNIICRDGSWMDKTIYFGNNLFQQLSRLHKPFSTGMFMLFDRQRFQELGGFHQHVHFAEDYQLSKQISRNRFGIVRGEVFTTNRRFQKMGHAKVVKLFFAAAFNSWNPSFFLRNHKYWET
jgi:glycosyltransferase involved in cell wall biosynthesis